VGRYDSTDLAAVRHRLLDLKRDWVVYITDAGQSSHFHLIFDAAKLAGQSVSQLGREGEIAAWCASSGPCPALSCFALLT
jgi:arginyl-tRNA synthetase